MTVDTPAPPPSRSYAIDPRLATSSSCFSCPRYLISPRSAALMTSDDDASSPARAQALFTPTLWANRSGSTTVRKVLHPARARDAAPAHHRSSWSSSSTSHCPPASPRASMLALPCSWRAPPRPHLLPSFSVRMRPSPDRRRPRSPTCVLSELALRFAPHVSLLYR